MHAHLLAVDSVLGFVLAVAFFDGCFHLCICLEIVRACKGLFGCHNVSDGQDSNDADKSGEAGCNVASAVIASAAV